MQGFGEVNELVLTSFFSPDPFLFLNRERLCLRAEFRSNLELEL